MIFRIAPRHYAEVDEARQREWELGLLDLNADCDGLPPSVTLERRPDGGAELVVEEGASSGGARVTFPYARLRSQLREYHRIIGQIARSAGGWRGSRDLESLDYAKKLLHDEAGEIIQAKLRAQLGVELPLPTARRLFTLIFLLSHELPRALINAHRRRGGGA